MDKLEKIKRIINKCGIKDIDKSSFDAVFYNRSIDMVNEAMWGIYSILIEVKKVVEDKEGLNGKN